MSGGALTYDELNRTANRLARAIIDRQGEGNEPVAILLKHGGPVIPSLLGVLKAGKIFVVIDPSFPEERIKYLLADSRARLLIVGNATLAFAKANLQEATCLINIDELETRFGDDNLDLCLSPGSLAALIYTSGSTGQPKGVMQTHRNILHTILRDTLAAHFSPRDRFALLRSPSTSGSIADLFDGLLNGAAVYPYSLAKDGFVHLAAWLIREEITVFDSVSSSFRHFVNALSSEKFPHLRLVCIGGEPIYANDVESYKKYFADECVLVVRMGCGEAGKVCQNMIDKNSEIQNDDVPVGYAHEDLQILILDEDGEPAKAGAIGEIAIRSRFLSPGYWHMGEMTESRFLADPNGGDERTYLSGDLGRLTDDGCLFHRGRKDSQTKIRGFQVEIAEVERVLLQHDGVKETIVIGQADRAGEMRLVAYCVPHVWPGITVSELRRWLRKTLPAYMIPSAFVMLAAMPTTPAGKLDRHGLPVPDDTRPALDHLYVAPRNPIEEIVVNIWEDVLGLKQVGIHDNFFDLGGHSLAATRIISRIVTEFEVELTIRFLVDSPTVAEMAAAIAKNIGTLSNEGRL
jgi:amino acid adenylation domain-containing protein